MGITYLVQSVLGLALLAAFLVADFGFDVVRDILLLHALDVFFIDLRQLN